MAKTRFLSLTFTVLFLSKVFSYRSAYDRRHCSTNNECEGHLVCKDQFCMDPCSQMPCGPHHPCHVANHIIMCTEKFAHRISNDLATSCSSNEECEDHLACIDKSCEDPCVEVVCLDYNNCLVVNHIAWCTDPKANNGETCSWNTDCDASESCVDNMCEDACAAADCGPQSHCMAINHLPTCRCRKGYTNAGFGCQPISAPGPVLAPTLVPGLPASEGGCSWHEQCAYSQACVQGRCDDPCDGLCGTNTSCVVRFHVPACACTPGHEGDPLVGCTPLPELKASDSWPPHPHGKKQFYLVMSKKVDWNEALLECLRNNTRLATVDNMEEMEVIRHMISSAGIRRSSFWTSGSDYSHYRHYVWVSSGQPLPLTSNLWLPGEPNHDNEHCVDVFEDKEKPRGFGLNNNRCHLRYYYICEYY